MNLAVTAGVQIGFGLDHCEVKYSFSVAPDAPESDTVVHQVLKAGTDIWGAMSDEQKRALYASIQPTIDKIRGAL